MVTQRQIAEKLGISRQLVGHALQGRPNVSPQTKQRIRAAAKDMGYHPEANWSARVMLAKRFGAAGQSGRQSEIEPEKLPAPPLYYVIRQPQQVNETNNMLFMDYLNGFVESFSAWKRGFQMCCPLASETDLDVVRHVVETGRCSGIICFADHHRDAKEYLIRKRFPMILFNEDLTPRGVPGVVADHVGGYAEAWRAAAQAGHRKVVFVGYREAFESHRNFGPRLRECQAGAARVGGRIEHVIQIPDDEDDTQGAWDAFVGCCGTGPDDSRWPTLAFTQNDMCAKHLIWSLQAHGVCVPRDISVIGFDDIAIARYVSPPLATLSKPRVEMARAGAELLGDVLAGRVDARQPAQILRVFPVRFIPRGSFAAAAKP